MDHTQACALAFDGPGCTCRALATGEAPTLTAPDDHYILLKAWGIIADGIKDLDPDADPEWDSNNFLTYVQQGVEAKKRLVALTGAAAPDFVTGDAITERLRCARLADVCAELAESREVRAAVKDLAGKIRSGA